MLCWFPGWLSIPDVHTTFAFHWCWSCGLHPYVKYFMVLGWAYEHWRFQFACLRRGRMLRYCLSKVNVKRHFEFYVIFDAASVQYTAYKWLYASVWKKHCLQYYQAFVKKLWRAKTLEWWNLSPFNTRFVGLLSVCEQHACHSMRKCYDAIRILLVNF